MAEAAGRLRKRNSAAASSSSTPLSKKKKRKDEAVTKEGEDEVLDKNEGGRDDLLRQGSFKRKGTKKASMGTKPTNDSNASLQLQGFVSFFHETLLKVGEIELKRPYIGRIIYEDGDLLHVQVFMRSSESYLKGFEQKNEYFGTYLCLDVRTSKILREPPKIKHKSDFDKNRSSSGTDFYQMRLDEKSGAFTSLGPTTGNECDLCEKKERTRYEQMVQMEKDRSAFKYKGKSYCVGSYALTTRLVSPIPDTLPASKDEHDPDVYTEFYRVAKSKTLEIKHTVLGVCQILEISTASTEGAIDAKYVKLKVRVFRQASDTQIPNRETICPHELFYTEEVKEISANAIVGQAYVAYKERLPLEKFKWIQQGDNRFCYDKQYTLGSNTLSDVPNEAKESIGHMDPETKKPVHPPNHKVPTERLKALDVFAGCGGLSQGLHEAGMCETKWAVERDADAAQSLKVNFKDVTVLNEDAKLMLKNMKEKKIQNDKGQSYPKEGEAELVMGGAPCQGFSRLNRYSQGKAAMLKNSLVFTFFSIIALLKPKFFIFENVKNFAFAEKGYYLKRVIARCLRMGYQVRFGILQAGAYGVPQDRQRIIILGALPGNKLPHLPTITHVFNHRSHSLNLDAQPIDDGTAFVDQNCRDAPFRTANVYDAISDLPDIQGKEKVSSNNTYSHCRTIFQEKARELSNQLVDHTIKVLSLLDTLRVSLIPCGGDWRYLPNIETYLPDDKKVEQLKYLEGTKVCPCQLKKNSKKTIECVKQGNTLIPWFLCHSGDRNGHYRQSYSRLHNFEPFKTTITSPKPSGKQGAVLHPTFHRCYSVRELARSQGFPDHFQFSGSLDAKYCQIGNAVPPPLAKRIGMCFP